MLALLQDLESEWQAATTAKEHCLFTSIGAFICITFFGSFRVFFTGLTGLHTYFSSPHDPSLPPHVIIPLLGRFKNETGARYHLTPMAAQSSSGINVCLWVSRLVKVRSCEVPLRGPAFCNSHGNVAQSQDYKAEILNRLQASQLREPSIISPDLVVHEEYGVSCSFSCGATFEARAHGVSPEDIYLIN
jgi:hypothetical protein